MRIFEKGNWENTKEVCPICGTQKEGKVILIGVDGTEEGNNMEAIAVHVDCLNLRITKGRGDDKIIYQVIRK